MKEFIIDHAAIEESELYALAERFFGGESSVYAVHTNRFYCGRELDVDVKHLLELRIFDEYSEFKASRSNMGVPFSWRYIDDSAFKAKLAVEPNEFLSVFDNRVYDEEHFLDINSKISSGTQYVTTGGGEYTLPVENAEKVKIRNYLDYDHNGIVIISDFRIVGFTSKEGEDNG